MNSTMTGFEKSFKGVHVLVLGASGFIGRWVARSLCQQGAMVNLVIRDEATSRKVFSKYGIHGRIFTADLRNVVRVKQIYETVRPSITFNLVGYGVDRSEHDEETAFQINAALLAGVCEAVSDNRDPDWFGQDIVHVGSALEYGVAKGDLSEDTIPAPTTVYGRSKLAGTQLFARSCETFQLKGFTARLFTVYGPGEHKGRLLPSLMEIARTGDALSLTAGTQKRDFTFVEDVSEGLLRLGIVQARSGGIVNLASGTLTSVRDFAETAAQLLNIESHQLKFGVIPTREEEMDHEPVSISRLQNLLGWFPSIGVEDGIQRTLNFVNFFVNR